MYPIHIVWPSPLPSMPVASSFKPCPYQSEGFLGLTQAQSRVGSKYPRSGSQPMMAEVDHNYSTFLCSRVGHQFSVASVVHSVDNLLTSVPYVDFFPFLFTSLLPYQCFLGPSLNSTSHTQILISRSASGGTQPTAHFIY